MSDERLVERPDATPPGFEDLVADDADEDGGDLGQGLADRGGRARPDPTPRPRRDPPAVVATVQPLLIELEEVDLVPLMAWELALPGDRRAAMDRLSKGERYRMMTREAMDRDMRADDARPPEDRHYDFPALFDSTYGQLRERGAAEAQRRALQAALATAARRLWEDETLHLTAEQLAGHLGTSQRELADWLGWTPERLQAADAERRADRAPRGSVPDDTPDPHGIARRDSPALAKEETSDA